MTPDGVRGRVFSVAEHRVSAQVDGTWWVLDRPGQAGFTAITEDRLLPSVLNEMLGSYRAEPVPAAVELADQMLRAKAQVPARPRAQDDGRPATEVAAVDWLVERVPELLPILDAHLDYMDELLAYVAFESDFVRWFIDAVKAGNDDGVRRFCDAIEWFLSTSSEPPADDRVWNLTAVCFTEALVMGAEDEVIARARPRFGPATIRDIDRMLRERG